MTGTRTADRLFVHAKISSLRGQLLRRDVYFELIHSRNVLSPFPSLAIESDEKDLTAVKEALFRHQIKSIDRIIRSNRRYAPLFTAFLRLYEVNNIKMLMARASGRKAPAEVWFDISPHGTADRSLLSEGATLEELRGRFRGSVFDIIPEEHGDISYEELEVMADRAVFANMVRYGERLSFREKDIFFDYMAHRAALLAITWKYRLLHLYRWPEEKVTEILDPLENLFACCGKKQEERYQEAKQGLLNSVADRFRDENLEDPESIVSLELFLEKRFYTRVSRLFHRDFHSIYPVISYLWLLYYQVQNLFRAAEGIRFKLSSDEILNRLMVEA